MVKCALGALAALMLIFVNGFAIAQTAMIEAFVPEAALVGEARFNAREQRAERIGLDTIGAGDGG